MRPGHPATNMGNIDLDTEGIKARLADPATVLDALGLLDGARREGHGFKVLCPWHAERTPSCSVRRGTNGTVQAHCFGCGRGGDVISLAATVLGLDVRADFPRLLSELAVRCGIAGDAARPLPALPLSRSVPCSPTRSLPPRSEVASLWGRCGRVNTDAELCAQLERRGMDPDEITERDLARVLPAGSLPRWCRAWRHTGHRLVFPLYDAEGNLACLHGRIVLMQPDDPRGKARSVRGCGGLVLADATALALLSTGTAPWWNGEVLICEGATDFLVLGLRWSDAAACLPAVIGIYAGSWSPQIASRIPARAVVRILTDPDEAGERYAAQIAQTLGHRCAVVQPRSHTEGSRRHG